MAQPPKPPPRPAQDLLDGLEAATADLDAISLVDLGGDAADLDPIGGSGNSLTLSPEPGARDLDTGVANLEVALERDETTGAARPPAKPTPAAPPPSQTPPAPRASPLSHEGDLALDFDAAGLAGPVKGQAAPGPESAQPKAALPTPAPRPEPTAPRRAPGEKIGLFGEDRIFGFLVGGAIGLLVGLYPAMRSAQGMIEEQTRDALAELEDAVDRPLAVRAGEVRAPGEIAADIEREYGPARSRFWVVWLGIAIPVGVGLGLVRRKA